jgi:hypothetical protein
MGLEEAYTVLAAGWNWRTRWKRAEKVLPKCAGLLQAKNPGLRMGRGSSGFKFRTARAGSRYLPTLNTT